MYVLLDIEWVQNFPGEPNPGRWLTQLSAARVDEKWTMLERFDKIVRPTDPAGCDWSFMSYNGYTPEQFSDAESEESCIKAFDEWLRAGDIFLCWHEETKRTMHYLCRRHLGHRCRTHSVRIEYGAERWLRESGSNTRGFYNIARACGLKTEEPEHCSRVDVDLLLGILCRLDFAIEKFEAAYPTRQGGKRRSRRGGKFNRRKRNAERMETIETEFIYTPASSVFHRRGCKLLLCAKEIRGYKYYRAAAQQRRPCKVCKPFPLQEEFATHPHRQAPGQKSKYKTVYMPCAPDVSTDDPDIFIVTLLGGKQSAMDPRGLVGCCHSSTHPGKITVKLMRSHQCANKHCKYFEPYKDTPGWKAWRKDERRRYRQRQKKKMRAEMPKPEESANPAEAEAASEQEI